MSKDSKFLSKPKVRFTNINCNDNETSEKLGSFRKEDTSNINRLKIRSVEILDKPVTFVKKCNPLDTKKDDLIRTTSIKEKTCSYASYNERASTNAQENSVESNNIESKEQMPLTDASSSENIKINYYTSDKLTIQDYTESNSMPKVPPLELPPDEDAIPMIKSKSKTIARVNEATKSKKGKENKEVLFNTDKKVSVKTKTKLIASESSKHLPHQKLKSNNSNTNNVKPCTSKSFNKKQTAKAGPSTVCTRDGIKPLSAIQRSNTKKSIQGKGTISVMPCHKHNLLSSKIKTSATKTKVLYDLSGHKIKPYIGPGMPKQVERTSEISKTDTEESQRESFVDRLSRPEYNSIKHTLWELQELKQEKLVTDIEHLPNTYKNLINKKISAMLNYPVNESIYKNLIDLSIEENDLPSRLTRSRDPVPSEKDIVPILSDFFTPEPNEEYCIPVAIKPCIPDITANWNAFKISDKILEWKHSVDDMQ